MIHLLYFIHTQQWLSGFGGTGSTHLALREPDKFYFADPACKRRRISANLQFLLHQSFCRPSIHWFLCDLEWARCKGSWERIGKGWNTSAFAIAHTNLFTEKKRENDDCLWEKWNSCTFYIDFNFRRWLPKRHCDCDCENHEKGANKVQNRKDWQRSTSTVWAPAAAIYGSSPPQREVALNTKVYLGSIYI